MAEFDADPGASALPKPSTVVTIGHTVGNAPSQANPGGVSVPEKAQPSTQPYDSFEYTAGTYGNYPNVGVAETAAIVAAALEQIPAKTAEYYAQSHAFIAENGGAVDGGHSPVNPAPVELTGNATGNIVDAG